MQGRGLSRLMVLAMRSLGQQQGLSQLISTGTSQRQKPISVDANRPLCHLTTDEGLPFNPWLLAFMPAWGARHQAMPRGDDYRRFTRPMATMDGAAFPKAAITSCQARLRRCRWMPPQTAVCTSSRMCGWYTRYSEMLYWPLR